MNDIPEHVDVIILGTSLTNSIIAAACSRIGKSVLHLDRNNYYGDDWASFTFQQLIDWIKVNYPQHSSLESINEELINKSRMFCLDLAPRFLYSNGPMVDLLVKSNVARYHEFKNNIRILCMIGDDIHIMPCRRNEVFTSPLMSNLADKRRLMKFIELCIKFDPDGGDKSDQDDEITLHRAKPVGQFLEDRGLSPTLREYIINSIAMVRPNETTEVACKRIKKFMVATERYGRSPFLFPLYGCGEFPQSFCRLSAVFGGVYCLDTQIDSLNINSKVTPPIDNNLPDQDHQSTGEFEIKFSDNKYTVKSDILVMDYNSAINVKDSVKTPSFNDRLSRAIIITKKSIVANNENNDFVSFLRIPPNGKTNAHLVFVLEFNSSALVCPKDMNIVYLWTRATANEPEQDLEPTVERIFKNNQNEHDDDDDDDCIIWKFYYHQLTDFANDDQQEKSLKVDQVDQTVVSTLPGLYITSPPCDEIDYGSNIREAERLFKLICPDQEFLPRAPDPDEIISS